MKDLPVTDWLLMHPRAKYHINKLVKKGFINPYSTFKNHQKELKETGNIKIYFD